MTYHFYMDERWTDRAKTQMHTHSISQETLAESLSCTRGAISHYLSGRRTPSLKQLELMAKVLHTDLVWLLYGDAKGKGIGDESGHYQPEHFTIPIIGSLSGATKKRKPVGHILLPSASQHYYGVLVNVDDYSPRIYSGEAILIDPETQPSAGDEILIHYKSGESKLHTFIAGNKTQISVDSISGNKHPQKLPSTQIKSLHKIIAVFRATGINE